MEKEFKPDISCRAFPDIFDITCQCLGASTHSAIVLPETNTINIHMIIKRLTTNHAPLILMITLVLLFFVLTIAAALIDRRDQKRLRPQVCQEAATLPCTYNVFIYTYLFRFHPGSDSDFILTLNGERNVYANDFINPTATYGSMLNLVFHAPYNLGSLMNITIRLMDANESWHVDRIIVCDSLSGENALFRVNGFVSF